MWVDDRGNEWRFNRLAGTWQRLKNGQWVVTSLPPGGLTQTESASTPTLRIIETMGPPGPSAYELAVKNGFSGSETTWLNSIRGEPGPPGEGAIWGEIVGRPLTFTPTIGPGAADAVAGNDPRLTDARPVADNSVTTNSVVNDSITLPKLSTSVQASLNRADSAVQSAPVTSVAGLSGAVSAAVLTDALLDGTINHVFTASDDAKLTAIAANATANATDAALRDRSTHTGQQLASTISDLSSAVTSVVSSSIAAKYTKPGTGIPSSDLDAATQASLGRADTAVQPATISGLSSVYQPLDSDLTALAALTAPATKLAAIANNATANSTDAVLLARANHTGTQLSSTISDFAEAAQDAVAALLAGASGVTLSYDDAANTLTVTGPGAVGLDAEAVRDAIGVAMVGVGNITVAVNDAADTITISTTATVNSTDAALRDRSTHTGTQSADTLTDGTTNKAFLATERTKLAAIAASATANSTEATTSTANTLAKRDANAFIWASGFIPSGTSTVTAAGTTTLGASQVQIFTGTTTQIGTLPSAGILPGFWYRFINLSSGAVTINSSGGNAVVVIPGGCCAIVTANATTPTTAAHWSAEIFPSELPSYVTTRSRPHAYDPVMNAYNWRPDNTRKLHAALGKAAAGSALQHLAVIGDSISAGYMGDGSTPAWEPTKAWPVVLRKLLVGGGVPTGGTGLVPISDVTQVAADGRWSTTGTWTASGLGYAGTAASGATATFVSDVAGTQVDVYYFGAGGAFTVNIDGLGAVTPTAGGSVIPAKYTVTGLANTTHTVVITASNTTNRYIIGASVSAASGLAIHNLAEGSSRTATWTPTTAGTLNNARFGSLALSSITPAAIFCELGVNDTLNSVTAATFKANITTLRSQFSTSDFILVGPPTWSTLSDEMLDLADTLDIPFIDTFSRYGGTAPGSPANVNGLVQDSSNVHPNQALHADWGRFIATLVNGTGALSPSSIVGITGTIAQFNTAVTDADLATLAGAETLSNKTITGGLLQNNYIQFPQGSYFFDTTTNFYNTANSTKVAQFAVPAGQTASTTRVHTLPAVNSTLASTADVNAVGRVFVQQADPYTTDPTYTGPALWYVLDGSGNIVGKKVRAS